MNEPRIDAVTAIELGVPDVEATSAFYQDVWALAPVAGAATSRYFRGTGGDCFVLALHQAASPCLVRLRLSARNRQTVDALVRRVDDAGGSILRPASSLPDPGGGYGFSFLDPEGRELVVCCDVQGRLPENASGDRPIRLGHIVLNSIDIDRATDFAQAALGFRLRDRTSKGSFLGCGAEHHSLAFTNRPNSKVGHIAFDLANLDAVMRGCGRLKRAGLQIEWGVGRHGTGDNVFAYFIDPNGFVIEYTAEMEQVDEATRPVGTPETNARPAHADVWGLAAPPSERFLRALMGPGG